MTGMDDLVTWLRAQLDDDERVARDAGDDSMRWRAEGPDRNLVDDFRTLAIAPYEGTLHEAEYIARWDPARVLAEVDAKRRLVDAHAQPHECIALTGSGDHSVVDGRPWALWEPENTEDHGPCFVVRCVALPYADRPGYREEWRP